MFINLHTDLTMVWLPLCRHCYYATCLNCINWHQLNFLKFHKMFANIISFILLIFISKIIFIVQLSDIFYLISIIHFINVICDSPVNTLSLRWTYIHLLDHSSFTITCVCASPNINGIVSGLGYQEIIMFNRLLKS